MSKRSSLYEINRDIVNADYISASKRNEELFHKGDIRGNNEYIYENQRIDAMNIVHYFYEDNIRAISIIKRTKVGMDGLMIEIAKNISTHIDDDFIIHRDNIFFITGMSNKSWENNMKEIIPKCFSNNVHHHGKLNQVYNKIKDIKDALIIIDEIDSGDKQYLKLHKTLLRSNIYDINYMEKNNIRFIFVSATIYKQIKDLYKWGDKHRLYKMTIPDVYIGHGEFLELNIIQEFYPVNNDNSAERWIKEDIIDNYKNDYRVHIIRTDNRNVNYISKACNKFKIEFRNHTSTDRIEDDELHEIFDNINNHIVIAIKGFYRRANLIPNDWKKKIGAMHEKYVKKYDTNVQIQGLPGRMCGYWKKDVLNGYKTGPYRTSVNAIKEYENFYENPLGEHVYNTITKKLMVNPSNVGITYVEPIKYNNKRIPVVINVDKNDILFELNGGNERLEHVKNIIKNNNEKLYNFIMNESTKCVQITKPHINSTDSYKKHITDVVKAFNKKKPFIVDLKKQFREMNNWNGYIDDREYRLCIVLWVINPELYSYD